MSRHYHQNHFATNVTTNQSAGVTTTPLNSIPSCNNPYYIALDATNVNGHFEIVDVTSDTATNINHAATTYAHSTDEEVRVVSPADELDDLSAKAIGVRTATSYSPAAAGTATLDLSLGSRFQITMPAGNITIALSNATTSQMFTVEITQDATGSRTVTWFTTIRWTGGSAPTLTTTANKRDTFGFICTGSNTYDGFVIGQNI